MFVFALKALGRHNLGCLSCCLDWDVLSSGPIGSYECDPLHDYSLNTDILLTVRLWELERLICYVNMGYSCIICISNIRYHFQPSLRNNHQ